MRYTMMLTLKMWLHQSAGTIYQSKKTITIWEYCPSIKPWINFIKNISRYLLCFSPAFQFWKAKARLKRWTQRSRRSLRKRRKTSGKSLKFVSLFLNMLVNPVLLTVGRIMPAEKKPSRVNSSKHWSTTNREYRVQSLSVWWRGRGVVRGDHRPHSHQQEVDWERAAGQSRGETWRHC